MKASFFEFLAKSCSDGIIKTLSMTEHLSDIAIWKQYVWAIISNENHGLTWNINALNVIIQAYKALSHLNQQVMNDLR